jgi:hypothetical protein
MKRAESTPKLLLLPLIPMLALGIVELGNRISAPAPIASMDQAPDVNPAPDRCDDCVMAA